MESQFFEFISGLVERGVITDTGLILFLILMISGLSYYVVKPIYYKVLSIPTVDDVKEIIINTAKSEEFNIEEIEKEINSKLDKLIEVLDEVEDLEKGSYREIKELKRDIEQIKQILNQFQGHLMYGRNSDFGNRELR